MKLYTSYWAQVRNFPQNLVGLNTTVWPPRWRPLGKDKRGVLCIDCPPFKPGPKCEGLCDGKCRVPSPNTCKFLNTYYVQLKTLDCNTIMRKLKKLADIIKEGENLEEINFAFIVYEAPNNLCSERWPIQKYFRENGIEIEEWVKDY